MEIGEQLIAQLMEEIVNKNVRIGVSRQKVHSMFVLSKVPHQGRFTYPWLTGDPEYGIFAA